MINKIPYIYTYKYTIKTKQKSFLPLYLGTFREKGSKNATKEKLYDKTLYAQPLVVMVETFRRSGIRYSIMLNICSRGIEKRHKISKI